MQKIILMLWALAVGFACSISVSFAESPRGEQFHLYLLIGQSNMAGRGKLDKASDTPPERVWKLNREKQWEPATEPLHFDIPSIAGAGLGLSFAEKMAARDPDISIGLIPCAVGGSQLSRWQKGADLYQSALERTRRAREDGVLKGILWHQGENDAVSKELAETYVERLQQTVTNLRTDLGLPDVPFVAGELGDFSPDTYLGKPYYWKIINEQLNRAPVLIPNLAVVKSDGLKDAGDACHFSTEALREFGERYAEAMIKLQGR